MSEPAKRGRGRPKGSTNRPKNGETLSGESTPAGLMARGVVARCGNGYLGLVTEGPKKLIVSGEPKELWTGIHITDDRNRKIGDHWASFQPTPLGRPEDIFPQ